MSKISQCRRCGGNIVEPAYEGDGAYPVGRMCDCGNGYTAPADDYRTYGNDCPICGRPVYECRGHRP